jgi:hypothetical protein
MTTRRPGAEADLDVRIDAWLDAGPDRAPAQFIDATLAPIPAMAQRRRSLAALGRMTVTYAALARLAAAAALVVAVGFAGFSIRGGPAGHDGSTPSPPPSPSALPYPLPSGVAYTHTGPLGAVAGNEPGVAGTYQTLLFRPVVRFTVPANWSVTSLVNTFVGGGEGPAGIPLGNGAGVIVVTTPTSVDPSVPGDFGTAVPADLIAWLVANPRLTLIGAPTPVAIAGFAGLRVEGWVTPGARVDPADGFYRPVDFLPLLPRHRFRIAVIRIGGQQVIVATVADGGTFGVFRAEADAVIGSFEFPAP